MVIKNGYVAGDDSVAPDGIGGGVYDHGDAYTGDTLTISDDDIQYNTAIGNETKYGNGKGGGVAATQVAVTIQNSAVSHNTATGPGGIGLNAGRTGNGLGGGVYVYGTTGGPTTLIVTHSTVSNNLAQGGSLTDADSGTAHAGDGDGGGVYFNSEYGGSGLAFSMTSTELDDNGAVGGTVTNLMGNATLYGGNGIGGGLDVLAADADGNITTAARVLDSTLFHNTASGATATIYSDPGGKGAYGGSAFAGGAPSPSWLTAP